MKNYAKNLPGDRLVIPFVKSRVLLQYTVQEMTKSMTRLHEKLRFKNLIENYLAILIAISAAVGVISLATAMRFSDVYERQQYKEKAVTADGQEIELMNRSDDDIECIKEDEAEAFIKIAVPSLFDLLKKDAKKVDDDVFEDISDEGSGEYAAMRDPADSNMTTISMAMFGRQEEPMSANSQEDIILDHSPKSSTKEDKLEEVHLPEGPKAQPDRLKGTTIVDRDLTNQLLNDMGISESLTKHVSNT